MLAAGIGEDLMPYWPVAVVVGGALLGWARWSMKAWLKANIIDPQTAQEERNRQRWDDATESMKRMAGEVSATKHLVTYHLGPNGDSPRLHVRVHAVERALGIDAEPPKPYPEPWERP